MAPPAHAAPRAEAQGAHADATAAFSAPEKVPGAQGYALPRTQKAPAGQAAHVRRRRKVPPEKVTAPAPSITTPMGRSMTTSVPVPSARPRSPAPASVTTAPVAASTHRRRSPPAK